jgi:4'-phosphopantetheinyl transferase EntD
MSLCANSSQFKKSFPSTESYSGFWRAIQISITVMFQRKETVNEDIHIQHDWYLSNFIIYSISLQVEVYSGL